MTEQQWNDCLDVHLRAPLRIPRDGVPVPHRIVTSSTSAVTGQTLVCSGGQ